jgi:hypothetical protein
MARAETKGTALPDRYEYRWSTTLDEVNDLGHYGWRVFSYAEETSQYLMERNYPAGAPVNTTVPHVSQSGSVLHCTMGEWVGVPTFYAYQWQLDGTDVGTNAADYTIVSDDVGKTATCVVTATNALGSTAAPPSDSIVVV